MSYAVWNFKGGVGKTTLSIQLSRVLDYDYVTNDEKGGAHTLVKDDRGFLIPEDLESIPFENEVIFDFGGWKDTRIEDVLEKCDKVIVPTLKSLVDIKTTLTTLKEISEVNSNVIVVFNRFNVAKKKREDTFNDLKAYILEELAKDDVFFDSIEFLTIRDSELLQDCQFDGDSIYDRIENSTNKGFYNNIYRNIVSDMDNLVKTLEV